MYELSSRLSGRREEDISHADTRMNANLWLLFMIGFFASVIYLYVAYGDYAPPPASEHGVALDWLMSFNIWIITVVFFLVNLLLFYFAYKYAYDKDRKSTFFAHDNRLELIWTVMPVPEPGIACGRALSGGYTVQPPEAAPPSTNKENTMSRLDTRKNQ